MRKCLFLNQGENPYKLTKVLQAFVRKRKGVTIRTQCGGSMMNKGSFSFVAMLVINPVVILFYQNCSMAPISHAKNTTTIPVITRQVASESQPVVADIKPTCNDEKKECPRNE